MDIWTDGACGDMSGSGLPCRSARQASHTGRLTFIIIRRDTPLSFNAFHWRVYHSKREDNSSTSDLVCIRVLYCKLVPLAVCK